MDNENSQLWKSVEQDKLKYKIFMFISLAAWAIAIGVLIYIGYLFYLDYQHIIGLSKVGLRTKMDLREAKQNIYIIVLSVSFIFACLSSLVFVMRQRSSSLHDIQIRLAMVEQHISEKE
jgi:hypothetical protein